MAVQEHNGWSTAPSVPRWASKIWYFTAQTPFCLPSSWQLNIGDVFRVSPNELSFASVRSYRDIYGFPPAGKPQFNKSDFYDVFGSGFDTRCIGSERDPKVILVQFPHTHTFPPLSLFERMLNLRCRYMPLKRSISWAHSLRKASQPRRVLYKDAQMHLSQKLAL